MKTCPYTAAEVAQMRKDYALLVSGKQARIIVDQNGERVEYTAANASRFYALINEAEACLLPGASVRKINRPLWFYF